MRSSRGFRRRQEVEMEVDGGGMQEVKIGKRVFVGNLAWRTSWQDLKVRDEDGGALRAAEAGSVSTRTL